MYQFVQCVQSGVHKCTDQFDIYSESICFCIKGGPAYSGSSKDGEDRASFIQSARPNEFTFVAFLLLPKISCDIIVLHYCRSAIVFVIF